MLWPLPDKTRACTVNTCQERNDSAGTLPQQVRLQGTQVKGQLSMRLCCKAGCLVCRDLPPTPAKLTSGDTSRIRSIIARTASSLCGMDWAVATRTACAQQGITGQMKRRGGGSLRLSDMQAMKGTFAYKTGSPHLRAFTKACKQAQLFACIFRRDLAMEVAQVTS